MNPLASSSIADVLSIINNAQGYFTNTLVIHTAIFAVIVAAVVGLAIYLVPRSLRGEIKTEVNREVASVTSQLKDEFSKFAEKIEKTTTDQNAAINAMVEKLRGEINDELRGHEKAMDSIRSETYRSLATFHRDKENWSTAFLWYLRAAMAALDAESSMTQTHLVSALKMLRKVENGDDLATDEYTLVEWNNFVSSDDASAKHLTEVDLLKKEFERALDKKPEKKA